MLVARWRRQHDQALLILDQFEELFTQNPPEVQERFASLLSRLALEADVHVLLSMRDDFLFHCTSQEALAPIYSELTPLQTPLGHRAAPRPGAAGFEVRLPLRRRHPGRRDGGRGRQTSAAPCRCWPSPPRGCGACGTASRGC